jgi:hypothetical protein
MSLIQFNPDTYGKIFSDLLDKHNLSDLGPGEENSTVFNQLQAFNIATAFKPHEVVDQNFADSCLSGLWLLHDFLDKSHQISQSIATSTGSFWHGIMHRREGDYWNSKYWFRQVENHPVFSPLNKAVKQLLDSSNGEDEIRLSQQAIWDPFLFVDLVQNHIGSNSEFEMILKQIQQLEWQILFDFCYRGAIGPVD